MRSKARSTVLSVFLALSLALLACNFGRGTGRGEPEATTAPRATRTAEAQPTEIEAEPTEAVLEEPTERPEAEPTEASSGGIVPGDIELRGITSYVDTIGYFHVSGLAFNSMEVPVQGIELAIQVHDGSGETVLQDESGNPVDSMAVYPMLYTLAQGESAPFDFYFLVPEGQDASTWDYALEVVSKDDADVDRGHLEVENAQVVSDEYGSTYLSGELVNLSDSPVLVSDLAGALLGSGDAVLATGLSYSYSRYLAPAGDEGGSDRTPFSISLSTDAGDNLEPAFFWDASISEPLDSAADVAIEITNWYVDEYDDLYLVGLVTNNGTDSLYVSVVGGVYAEDGTVLDAATASTPIYVAPAEVVPVTLEWFSNLNTNSDELARIADFTIQVDAYLTYATDYQLVELDVENETYDVLGEAVYNFSGEVVNVSDQEVSSATVVIAIVDGDDNLVAARSTSVYPEGDTMQPGDRLPFELTLYMAPDVDTSNYSYIPIVQGYVP